jgi:hypothetical protein
LNNANAGAKFKLFFRFFIVMLEFVFVLKLSFCLLKLFLFVFFSRQSNEYHHQLDRKQQKEGHEQSAIVRGVVEYGGS